MGETATSLVITVEGKEVERWREQGCWEQHAERCPWGAGRGERETGRVGPCRLGEARAAAVHGQVQTPNASRGRLVHGARATRGLVAARRLVLVASDHLAAPAGGRHAGRTGAQTTGTQARPGRPLGCRKRTAAAREPAAGGQASLGRNDHRGSKKTLRDPGDSPLAAREQRENAMKAIEELAAQVGTAAACRSLGVPRRPSTGIAGRSPPSG